MPNFDDYATYLDGASIVKVLEAWEKKHGRRHTGSPIVHFFYDYLFELSLNYPMDDHYKTQMMLTSFDERIFNGRTKSEWHLGKHNIWNADKSELLYSISFVEMKNNPTKLEEFGRDFPKILKQIDAKLSGHR